MKKLSDEGTQIIRIRIPMPWLTKLKAGLGVSGNVRAAIQAWMGNGSKGAKNGGVEAVPMRAVRGRVQKGGRKNQASAGVSSGRVPEPGEARAAAGEKEVKGICAGCSRKREDLKLVAGVNGLQCRSCRKPFENRGRK